MEVSAAAPSGSTTSWTSSSSSCRPSIHRRLSWLNSRAYHRWSIHLCRHYWRMGLDERIINRGMTGFWLTFQFANANLIRSPSEYINVCHLASPAAGWTQVRAVCLSWSESRQSNPNPEAVCERINPECMPALVWCSVHFVSSLKSVWRWSWISTRRRGATRGSAAPLIRFFVSSLWRKERKYPHQQRVAATAEADIKKNVLATSSSDL